MYCFYEDGRRLLTRFVVDERLTFCLGLTRIARNFLVFVRAFIDSVLLYQCHDQLKEVYKRTDVPVGLYSFFRIFGRALQWKRWKQKNKLPDKVRGR